ncbi:hypothetical protein MRB53_023141 [Persea americana]|uniref:Uncharacterized protein n=1 Tax=Persea americana TaxID=3435 RepID=A0ACC2L9U1_PERAE|nr:hypothetical protein MRB53_023141 [Persea americana]
MSRRGTRGRKLPCRAGLDPRGLGSAEERKPHLHPKRPMLAPYWIMPLGRLETEDNFVHSMNVNGSTALDVAQGIRARCSRSKIKRTLKKAGRKKSKEISPTSGNRPKKRTSSKPRLGVSSNASQSDDKIQDSLMVVAILIATVTYGGVLNPPGGTESGKAIMSYKLPGLYVFYTICNTVAFVVSLILILTLAGRKRYLTAMTWIAVSSLLVTYALSFYTLCPNDLKGRYLWAVVPVIVVGWLVTFRVLLLRLMVRSLKSLILNSFALLYRSRASEDQRASRLHTQAELQVVTISPDNQTLTLETKAVDDFKAIDPTSLLSDSLLLRIFSLLPSSQYLPNSLVCKRWLALHGRLRRSLKLLDSSSFTSRFSDLTEIDLIAASVHSQSPRSSSYIFLTLPIHSDDSAARFVLDELFLPPDYIDIGLRTLSSGCPNLWKLTLIAETKAGLASIAAECPTLQELELHRCTNDVLSTIASFENLQILRVIAFVEGLYDDSSISDVGLTILAHDCRCLVKLELSGCEGSYEGISAIGPCCPMLEELTLCDHWMDGGWLAPLSFCGNLKTLRLEGCKKVDANPGQVEHLGLCLALKTLQLRRCQLQDKESLSTLFIVCATVREIIFQNFWGLDNDMFSIASICRSYYQIGFEADGSKGVDIVPFEEPFAGEVPGGMGTKAEGGLGGVVAKAKAFKDKGSEMEFRSSVVEFTVEGGAGMGWGSWFVLG